MIFEDAILLKLQITASCLYYSYFFLYCVLSTSNEHDAHRPPSDYALVPQGLKSFHGCQPSLRKKMNPGLLVEYVLGLLVEDALKLDFGLHPDDLDRTCIWAQLTQISSHHKCRLPRLVRHMALMFHPGIEHALDNFCLDMTAELEVQEENQY